MAMIDENLIQAAASTYHFIILAQVSLLMEIFCVSESIIGGKQWKTMGDENLNGGTRKCSDNRYSCHFFGRKYHSRDLRKKTY